MSIVYMYKHIVVVVFGILMEFVLYTTVIAGTTTNKHQHNVPIVRAFDDDGDPTTSSSSFVPELLYCFLFATKDCIRLNCGYCFCCYQQFSNVAAAEGYMALRPDRH